MDKVRFYIGETISLTLEALDSETGESLNVMEYEFLLSLYTNRFEPIIMTTLYSVEKPERLQVIRVDETTLQVNIPSKITKKLRPGIARFEIKARDSNDNWRSIASLSTIEFLPSLISQVDED